MKAEELRIGNFVYTCLFTEYGIYDDEPYIITVDDLVSMVKTKTKKVKFPYVGIEPIPLIEEWSKKLSDFDFHEFSVRIRNPKNKLFKIDEFCVTIEQYSEGECFLQHIKFVHQYQNLYFALTGEELTIKL